MCPVNGNHMPNETAVNFSTILFTRLLDMLVLVLCAFIQATMELECVKKTVFNKVPGVIWTRGDGGGGGGGGGGSGGSGGSGDGGGGGGEGWYFKTTSISLTGTMAFVKDSAHHDVIR